MKIVIVGTRGIPDFYRGFEKGAQLVARGLADRGHDVTVYCAHNHPYQKSHWRGIELIHVYDPEYKLGSVSNFFYDYFCFKDLRNRACDLVIQYGPSSGIWSWMLPKNMLLVSNISTIEWRNKKYNTLTSKFLELAEKFTVRYSHSIVSDSNLSCSYLRSRYKKRVKFIPPGVEALSLDEKANLDKHYLKPYSYSVYIGSLEKQNHIEMILDGFVMSSSGNRFLVVGHHGTRFGNYLQEKYKHCTLIEFCGPIYDKHILNRLRYFSDICYYGRDEPTYLLYDAMAANCIPSAYGSSANRDVLGNDALYFTSSFHVSKQLLLVTNKKIDYRKVIENNNKKTTDVYNWLTVIEQYASHLGSIFSSRCTLYSNVNTVESKLFPVNDH